jgi:hypothetical protein
VVGSCRRVTEEVARQLAYLPLHSARSSSSFAKTLPYFHQVVACCKEFGLSKSGFVLYVEMRSDLGFVDRPARLVWFLGHVVAMHHLARPLACLPHWK